MAEAKEWGACDALQTIASGSPWQRNGKAPEVLLFAEWFRPADVMATYWWAFSTEGMNARVMALLFMEQIEADK